jgi:hypothetical protein
VNRFPLIRDDAGAVLRARPRQKSHQSAGFAANWGRSAGPRRGGRARAGVMSIPFDLSGDVVWRGETRRRESAAITRVRAMILGKQGKRITPAPAQILFFLTAAMHNRCQ